MILIITVLPFFLSDLPFFSSNIIQEAMFWQNLEAEKKTFA